MLLGKVKAVQEHPESRREGLSTLKPGLPVLCGVRARSPGLGSSPCPEQAPRGGCECRALPLAPAPWARQ